MKLVTCTLYNPPHSIMIYKCGNSAITPAKPLQDGGYATPGDRLTYHVALLLFVSVTTELI